jgi:hypothetical protein
MAGGQSLISWLHPCSTSNVALNTRTCAHGPLMGHPNWAGCYMWRAPDEPTPRKNIASVHPTLPFSVAVRQRLFGCLGLFIPPPLTRLRLLDCLEVQEGARHLDDHIQSIEVLNCSFLD